jgi:hypothetical protein
MNDKLKFALGVLVGVVAAAGGRALWTSSSTTTVLDEKPWRAGGLGPHDDDDRLGRELREVG